LIRSNHFLMKLRALWTNDYLPYFDWLSYIGRAHKFSQYVPVLAMYHLMCNTPKGYVFVKIHTGRTYGLDLRRAKESHYNKIIYSLSERLSVWSRKLCVRANLSIWLLRLVNLLASWTN
jgi:hypothetical protein